MRTIRNDVGQVDVWINNAATGASFMTLDSMSYKHVRESINTNLTATIVCTKFALEVIKSQTNGGHIFNYAPKI